MRKQKRVVAIVAAFNEAETIAGVTKVLVGSKLFDDVLVVDDGSKDKTSEVAAKAGATVITLKKNGGKGNAMNVGVEKSKADIIFFADADILGLTKEHIASLLDPVIKGEAAMAAGVRDRGEPMTGIAMRYLPLLGGERALLKKVWEVTPARFKERFLIETGLNYYCRKMVGRLIAVKLTGLTQVIKEKKRGFWKGLWARIKMIYEVALAMILVRIGK